MRQLGGDELEDEPGRNNPRQAEPHGRLATILPDPGKCRQCKARRRPERNPVQQKINSWRRAMPLLSGGHLAHQALADRNPVELAVADDRDRDEPRHDQQCEPGEPEYWTERLEPGYR